MKHSRRHTQNEKCGIIGIVGGLLMLIGGVTGAMTWRSIGEQIVDITGVEVLGQIFQVLAALGSLGGLLVILGSILIGWQMASVKTKNRVKTGKLMITIGAGFGLLGLLVFVLLTLIGDDPYGNFKGALTLGFIGLICSIYARQKSR